MFEAIKIYQDSTIDIERVKKRLVDFGYNPVSLVNERGDFAFRGNILDIYPATYDEPIRIEFFGNKVDSIFTFDINTGKIVDYMTILVVLPIKKHILGRFKGSAVYLGRGSDISNFTEVVPGDYVVHIKHGIGRFLGVRRLKTDNGYEKHLVIEYADNDKLYVSFNKIHMVQKYIGFSNLPPKLHKLGSKRWQMLKRRVNKGVETLASELLQLQAMRSVISGFKFSKDHPWQEEFDKSFPYKETPDQKKAIEEVKSDMESSKPMDRLICGDVGYGKTEVAFRAAFKAVMDNKQVAMLVPTTILAQQHFNNLKERVKDFPIEVRMLSRFSTSLEIKNTLLHLKEGKVDIIIGTHRLLSDDVKFKDLGLVIIDEEQRFGVRDKEKLKTLRLLVDVLTLTATPIPRTLYMSIMEVKDISIINTPPEDRLAVETYVLEFDEELIRQVVLRELARGGQVYFVHNRVKDIERVKDRLEKLLPEARIEIAHGQMPDEILEETMERFINKEVDILLSTNIIESGLDIPNVNTLIVNMAHMFGLSDLYQLKGRIGRFNKKAYCYFMIPPRHSLSKESCKRLEIIERFTDLGSGFRIAMEDLELRGAGNLLGAEQHGYISAVGFDLYCRLLKKSVDRLKKINVKDKLGEEKLAGILTNN